MVSNRTRWTACAAAVVLIAAPPVLAGAFADELGSDPAVLAGKVKLSMGNGNQDGSESGRGPVPYYKGLGAPPKRVALLSFYVWDCGNKKQSLWNPVYKYKSATNVTSEAIDVYANELYNVAFPQLKEGFAAHGMQLLTPDEYLDTEEKRAGYQALNIEKGFGQKFFGFGNKGKVEVFAGEDVSTTRFTAAPEGYRVLQLMTVMDVKGRKFEWAATGAGVGKLAQLLGHDVAKALGVDAVVILYNVVQAEKTAINMYGSYIYMFGPNPVPDTGQSLYWNGHQYSGQFIRMDVPFIRTDKDGGLIASDYEGYAPIARALANGMGQFLEEKIAK
jgi:hypothetical protein